MANLILRVNTGTLPTHLTKGSPLTHAEMDTNWTNLDDEIHQNIDDIADHEVRLVDVENKVTFAGPSYPAAPAPILGSTWFDTTTNTFYAWDGTQWSDTGQTTPIGATAPTPTTPGDMWYDTTTFSLYIWDGTVWVPVQAGCTLSLIHI